MFWGLVFVWFFMLICLITSPVFLFCSNHVFSLWANHPATYTQLKYTVMSGWHRRSSEVISISSFIWELLRYVLITEDKVIKNVGSCEISEISPISYARIQFGNRTSCIKRLQGPHTTISKMPYGTTIIYGIGTGLFFTSYQLRIGYPQAIASLLSECSPQPLLQLQLKKLCSGVHSYGLGYFNPQNKGSYTILVPFVISIKFHGANNFASIPFISIVLFHEDSFGFAILTDSKMRCF